MIATIGLIACVVLCVLGIIGALDMDKKIKTLEAENQKLRNHRGRLKKDYAYECMRYHCCLVTLLNVLKEHGREGESRQLLKQTRLKHEDAQVAAMTEILDKQYPED